jgi:adenosine deaminase CECR1
MKIVKEKGICIECCPVSNFVLGYITDLRNHPVRGLLHAGLPVSINPDDPGFMNYEGVTLDYVYSYLAWDLDIADLKQLCLNSLIYSSISENEKAKILLFFEYKW